MESSVFRFLKMWHDDNTARLDRFSHIALKLTLGLQNFCNFFIFALFDIFSWADFKRINRHIPSGYICDKMFIFWALVFLIFVSNGTVSSKIFIFSSILSMITRSGFSAVTRGGGNSTSPWNGTGNQSISIKF